MLFFFFFSSRRRHTRCGRDWSSDVCSSDLSLEGEAGRTSYADGAVRIESAGEEIVVRPAFGLEHTGEYDAVHLGPLFDALAEDHVVGVLFVRLGGYAVGVFDGER